MRRGASVITAMVLASVGCALGMRADEEKPLVNADGSEIKSVLDFTMDDIEGKPVELGKKYKDKVLLVVNVASKCGLTKQYEQLQAVHEQYHEQGLAVVGFPANNFLGQEPGTNKEIAEFCSSTYNVTFDLFSKISVKGDDMHDMYRFLTSKKTNGAFAGEIRWNFDKFLVDREGKVIARFHPRTKPDDEKVIKAIEAALEKK